MSYASWFGPGAIDTIPNNTTITSVTQNGSNYTTSINVAPTVISRNSLLSTMVDEVTTTFFQTSNVQPGLYEAGFWYSVGTTASDVWTSNDYFSFFVASQDFINNPNDGNAQTYYKTRSTYVNPYFEGVSPTGGYNGTVQGTHRGFINVSSIQTVSYCAFMEDYADNASNHSVVMADPYIRKIG